MSIFGKLAALRAKPIPAPGDAHGYHAIPIAFDAAANAEPLVDLAQCGIAGQNFYAQARNPPYYQIIPGSIEALLVREGVAARLLEVNARLAEHNLELFVYDGWRPQAVQAFFYEHWLPDQLRVRRPDLDEEGVRAETGKYWAAPSTRREAPSPHATGGAVDLTIRWRGGDPLWMGSLLDDASAVANTAQLETNAAPDAFSFSDEEARANRRLLYWLMTDAGFASNPTEWWHYSFGDQMWAKLSGRPQALYAGTEMR
ncbi:MAG: M15 family metallopeptidase [Hyphomonadaceae bacterium]